MKNKAKLDVFTKEFANETFLDRALNKALEQQSQLVSDIEIEKNGHKYSGPHKHIVAIVGSDNYSTHYFVQTQKKKIESMENLSISILGLSSSPLQNHSNDFVELAKMTSEGTYMMLTDRSKLATNPENPDVTTFDKLID